MKSNLLRSPLLYCSIIFLFSSCNVQPPHRLGDKKTEQLETGVADCKKVTLCHVEIDDQGELFSYKQLESATNLIKQESKKERLLVVVFVHGWNNNSTKQSKHGGGNLASFKKSLQQLAKASKSFNLKPFGVFVSWRGKTLKTPSVRLDYFHRYSAAQRVGGVAGTEVIHQLGYAARNARKGQNNRIVMIGHSMGGLILESAVSEVLAANIAKAYAQNKTLRANDLPADLVVTINPAESGLVARRLVAAMVNRNVKGLGKAREAPFMVSLTSEKDSATGTLFPVANFAGRYIPPFNLFNTSTSGYYSKGDQSHADEQGKTYPWGKQWRAHSRTVGHFHELHSHHHVRVEESSKLDSIHELINENQSPWNQKSKGGYDFKVRGESNTYYFKDNGPERYNRSPYWIMRVPKQMVGNHNDIWGPDFVGMLTALMHLREPDAKAILPRSHSKKGKKVEIELLAL